jgi:Ni/Co efflux regulator RcnB
LLKIAGPQMSRIKNASETWVKLYLGEEYNPNTHWLHPRSRGPHDPADGQAAMGNRSNPQPTGVPMKILRNGVALSILTSVLVSGAAFAQDRDDHHDNHTYVKHDEWKKGYHMQHQDWDRGEKVDYQTYHLRRPPSGYEWRLIDGNYVLAAVATGVVASVVVASTIH